MKYSTKNKKIQAPISYQGSKRRELKYINQYEPKSFNTLIDVFGGGGSVSIYYIQKSKKVVYNDINKGLYDLFNILQDETSIKKLQTDLKSIDNNEETFYKIFDSKESALKMLYLTKHCFRGVINRRLPNKDKEGNMICKDLSYSKLNMYPKILKNNFISINSHYKDLLLKYKDDKEVFLYLDPPYISKKNDYEYSFNVKDIEFIKDFMFNCKCKVMLHIDYTGYTRENFDKFYKIGYSVKYGCNQSNKDVYGKYHLIATNY